MSYLWRMNYRFLLFLSLLWSACSAPETQPPAASKAQQIIDAAINAHGGQYYDNLSVRFRFRDKSYDGSRNFGKYTYRRTFTDSLGLVQDELTNTQFVRNIDGIEAELPAKKIRAYSNSVNSVFYFFFLPFGLNDAAVNKESLGTASLNGQIYDKVKVYFSEEGGGEDHQD
ncbi:MAG: DUF6503 family protein, partial [Bacteroidota bacterium]